MNEILFELRFVDGRQIVAYENGEVTGIPANTIIINRWPLLLNSLRVQQEIEYPVRSNQRRHKTEATLLPLQPP